MLCPYCQQEIRDAAKFCSRCGHKIARCPACDRVITSRVRFCEQDGTPLPEELLADLPDPPADRPLSSEAAADLSGAGDLPSEEREASGRPGLSDYLDRTVFLPRENEEDGEIIPPDDFKPLSPDSPGPSKPRYGLTEDLDRDSRTEEDRTTPLSPRFCILCGAPAADGSGLCPECAGQRARRPGGPKRAPVNRILVVLLIVLFVIALGLGIVYAYGTGRLPFLKPAGAARAASEQNPPKTEGDIMIISPQDGDSVPDDSSVQSKSFPGVSPSNPGDYDACLDPEKYHRLESTDGRFWFSYPDGFFSQATHEDGRYTFSTKDGSVTMSVRKETALPSEDPVACVRRAHDSKKPDFMLQPDGKVSIDLVSETSKDGWAHALLGGKTQRDSLVSEYYIAVSDGDALYVMNLRYPNDATEESHSKRGYMVDCVYRYCAHSGSTYKVRTYDMYMNDDMGEKRS